MQPDLLIYADILKIPVLQGFGPFERCHTLTFRGEFAKKCGHFPEKVLGIAIHIVTKDAVTKPSSQENPYAHPAITSLVL